MSASLNTRTTEDETIIDNPLRQEFIDEDADYRYGYAEDFSNTYIATQIKVLRDERKMTQEELANAIGTKQSGISRLENVNYTNWKTETLRKIARALGVRLRISFETFGSLLTEDINFSKEALVRPKFEDDPAFKDKVTSKIEAGTPAGLTQELPPRMPFIIARGGRPTSASVAQLKEEESCQIVALRQ